MIVKKSPSNEKQNVDQAGGETNQKIKFLRSVRGCLAKIRKRLFSCDSTCSRTKEASRRLPEETSTTTILKEDTEQFGAG